MDTSTPDSTSEPLSLKMLSTLSSKVDKPSYERDSLSAGILHFGPGNFHKAHQAVYLDKLLNSGRDQDWAIIGASVMPADATLREVTCAQDLLTTVVTQSATVSEARITAAMIDYLPVGDSKAILDAMANPAIRIVSLTVTEGGYFVDPISGSFDKSNVDIVADAATYDMPNTVFGLIVKALDARRSSGQPAFTVMSCDNLPHNGVAARNAVIGFAELVDPSLAAWITDNSSFPNGMVDRITPATGDFGVL